MAGIAVVLGINIKGCNSGSGLTGGIFCKHLIVETRVRHVICHEEA